MTLNIFSNQIDNISYVEILTMEGTTLFKKQFQEANAKIDISEFTRGTYLLKMSNKIRTLTTRFTKP